MEKTNPSPSEILSAIATLSRVSDWSEVVGEMDGVDDRLSHVRGLAEILSDLAHEVSNDIDAVAYGEQKEARQSDEPHRGLMYANSYASNLQAAQASAFAAAVVSAEVEYQGLQAEIKAIPDSMTEADFDRLLGRS